VGAQVADDEFDGVGDDVRDAIEGQAVAVVQRPRGVGAGQAQHHCGGFRGGLGRRTDSFHRSPDRFETFDRRLRRTVCQTSPLLVASARLSGLASALAWISRK